MSVSSSISPYRFRALTQPVLSLRQVLEQLATESGLRLPASPPGKRPNTDVTFEIYNAESSPVIASPLSATAWGELMRGYPGELPNQLQGMIRHGAKIAYDPSGPLRVRSRRTTKNLPMSEEEMAHVERETRARIEMGTLRLADETEHLVASPIGAVPKPSLEGVKKFRSIHNLSHPKGKGEGDSVNDGIDGASVTMNYATLESMFRDLGAAARMDPENRQGRVLWKVDLKDAYRHVVVEQADARLLGYYWPGIGFVYETQLSFGGRSAPFIFNLFAEGFEWVLRSFGLECSHYLDDTFGWLDNSHDAAGVVDFVERVAQALGLTIAPHKTMLGHVVEILGVTIDCQRSVAYISTEKCDKIRWQIERMGDSATLLEIQSVTGSLVFVTRVCTIGKAFLRRLFDQVRICEQSPFGRRRMTLGAQRELRWWKETLSGLYPVRYLADDPAFMPQLHVWSDASGSLGIGGHLDNPGDEFSEKIPKKHLDKTILFKEALAVLRCAELWADRMHRHQVVFHVDNQALVAALNKGSCDHRPTQALIRKVYTYAARNSFAIRAVWLSSEDNIRADRLSRFKTHLPAPAHDFDDGNPHFDPDIAILDGDDMSDDDAYPVDEHADLYWFNQFA